MLRPCIVALVALVHLAGPSAAQEAPQDDVMVHVDAGSGALRFIPSEFTVKPGGIVQLMIFGQDSGAWSLTLDGAPELSADVDTSAAGFVHVGELRAPSTPGRYPFHDKHHPEPKGVLVVAAATPPIEEARGTPGAPAFVLLGFVALVALAITPRAPRRPQR